MGTKAIRTAKNLKTDTSGFDNNLSGADDETQKALQTINDFSVTGSVSTKVIFPRNELATGEVASEAAPYLTGVYSLVHIPFEITINHITFSLSDFGGDPIHITIALYSEDGQTKLFTMTSAALSGPTMKTTLGSPVTIPAGVYWLAWTNDNSLGWLSTNNYYSTNYPLYDLSGELVILGTLASETLGVLPATFNPSALTATYYNDLIIRFDN